jgi:regulator of protease activity HflC (stomatin/prohibitin superfamily)
MSYFVWFGLIVLLFVVARVLIAAMGEKDKQLRQMVGIGSWVFLVASFGLLTASYSAYQIPTGHIGVIYEFGAIKGQVEEGLQFTLPWRSAKIENTQIQSHVFKQLSCFSKESQTVHVDATLNIRVSKDAIQQLFRTVGATFFEVLVKPRVYQNFKDEIVKYESVMVAPNREIIRKAVSTRLESELKIHSIEVVDLLLDNVDFSDAFEQAIEQKQIASQKSLEEEQKIKIETNKAMQAVERAKGEGAAMLAKAEKEAEANRQLSASLTPALLQYALIHELGKDIKVIMMPTGSNFILDPGTLLKDLHVPAEKK